MRNILTVVLCLVLTGCVTPDKTAKTEKTEKGQSVRQRFVPSDSPRTSRGSKYSAFMDFPPGGNELTVLADVRIGEKFPVAEKDKEKVFEILVKDGNDKRLIIDVILKDGTKTLKVHRDKPVFVDVAGIRYKITFPNITVPASSNKVTTDRAVIFISKPKTAGTEPAPQKEAPAK